MGRTLIEQAEVELTSKSHPQPAPELVRAELARVIGSSCFVASRRCQQFLQYVCDKALEGEVAALKERTIAVDVFGRKLHADLGEDTIVRVGAREVRKRLAQFYSSGESADSAVRISLPSGSYVPEFRLVDPGPEVTPAGGPPPVVADAPPVRVARAVPTRRTLAWIAAATVAAVALLALIRPTASDRSGLEFQRFWEPVFQSPEPLLVVVGNPLVYHASSRAIQVSENRLPPMELPGQRPVELRDGELTPADLVPIHNQYVGFGDMVVGTEVASMLARRSRGTRVRLASSVPFADLRQNRSLLIGAITNRWTMELGRDWRFRFVRTTEGSYGISDFGTSPPKFYTNVRLADGSITDDYLVVSRVVRSSAGGLQIVAAGIKQFGTEAAGRVLTDPAQLSGMLRQLPSGWESKNVQLLLHVRVIGNTPDQPEVVGTHVW